MNILIINEVCGTGSTGKICLKLAEQFSKQGNKVMIGYGRHKYIPKEAVKYAVRIGNSFDVFVHAVLTRLFDCTGLGICSYWCTKTFLRKASSFKPDLVWLHNLHGYYINFKLLFTWIKENDIQVKWTLHDCWSFTGHCSHFSYVKCIKWKTQCEKCPQRHFYPKSFIDKSFANYNIKKKLFTGVKNMTLIVPSNWLSNLVKKSFLSEYPVLVQRNSIDQSIFKKRDTNLRQMLGLDGKTILLCVASTWNERKGLNDILKLITFLDDRFSTIIVGLTSKQKHKIACHFKNSKRSCISISDFNVKTDLFTFDRIELYKHFSYQNLAKPTLDSVIFKNNFGSCINQGFANILNFLQANNINDNAKGSSLFLMGKTKNGIELSYLYSMADYFINPTYEDTYPTVNLEAVACGLYVLTYNTGGCIETLKEADK